jgi:acetyltransferase-like isoleucine patch superfamily enzyme
MVWVEERFTSGEAVFAFFGELLSLIPGKIGSYLRVAYYHGTLQGCAWDVVIAFGSKINHRPAEVGAGVVIGAFCNIGTVTIGPQALIGSCVSLLSGGRQHDTTDDNERLATSPPVFSRIYIGGKTWIGERSVILADVGERCVVSAGSVVLRSVPDRSMVMGNPARVISKKFAGSQEVVSPDAVELDVVRSVAEVGTATPR